MYKHIDLHTSPNSHVTLSWLTYILHPNTRNGVCRSMWRVQTLEKLLKSFINFEDLFLQTNKRAQYCYFTWCLHSMIAIRIFSTIFAYWCSASKNTDSSVFYTEIETKILNTDSDPKNTDRGPITRVIAMQQITVTLIAMKKWKVECKLVDQHKSIYHRVWYKRAGQHGHALTKWTLHN